MHEGDHDVSWEGRNAFKHEVRREEGAGGGSSTAAKMQMHYLCLGGDGSRGPGVPGRAVAANSRRWELMKSPGEAMQRPGLG